VRIWKKIKFIPEKSSETPQSNLHSPGYILAKGCFKQWKIAIDNGWPVLYSGFGGGA
jgi:hypothetical protein